MSGEYNVSTTFNVSDLTLFDVGDNLRSNPDVYHGNYNPSHKAKSNMQEDSDGLMTRVGAKQLQRVLTSQIGMIEAVSELKTSNLLKLVQGCLFAYNWNLEMGKTLNGSFDVGLLEYELVMQIREGIDAVRMVDEFELEFEVIHCM